MGRGRRRGCTTALAVGLAAWGVAASPLWAQPPVADANGAVYRAGVELVALNVAVTDTSGDTYVSSLSRDDFLVLEEGVPQTLSVFTESDVPLDLALLLDTSASVLPKIDLIHEAAVGLIGRLRPGDRAGVIGFNGAVRVLQPFTTDLQAASRAVEEARPSGRTAFHLAMYVTLKEILKQQTGEVRRQALVVLSDGQDTASPVEFDAVLDLVKRSAVTVYTVLSPTPPELLPEFQALADARYQMGKLATLTGGRCFKPADLTELSKIYETIGRELAHQYLLGFTPDRTAEGFRKLDVRVPSMPSVQVRARQGYIPQ